MDIPMTVVMVSGYVLLCILGVYMLLDASASRKKTAAAAALEPTPEPTPEPTAEYLQPAPLDPAEMGRLIGRIGIIEGQLIALKTSVDQLQSMGARIAGVESQLPVVADAYEKYTSVLQRLEKRVSTRDQREAKREGKTVEEVVGNLFPPAAATPKAPPQTFDVRGNGAGKFGPGIVGVGTKIG